MIDTQSDSGVVITFTDISERRRIERMKDELVSVVSHELRTPLTSIRGSLGLIAGGAVGEIPAEAHRMIEIAVSNTDRLVRLINEMLDMERIESGRVELSRRLCDSEELMQDAAATMAAQAEAEGTWIEVEPCWVPLWADPDRIMQTLINLLSNAIKFSPRDVPVQLKAFRDDNEIRFEVIDKGREDPGRPAREGVRALWPSRRLRLAREGRDRPRLADRTRDRPSARGEDEAESTRRGDADVVHPAGRRLEPGVDEGGGAGRPADPRDRR